MKKRSITLAVVFSGLAILACSIWAVCHARGIRHVVLISIDTCRADHLSCYGYPKNTTPGIDKLAAEATRFESVVTPAPITLPAHSSMMTGMIPPAHGVHHNVGYQLASSNRTLAEVLKENGFKTGAIVSAFVLDKQFGLNQGFDTYDDSLKQLSNNEHGIERNGNETTRIALDWLDKNKDGKSFLFLHYYDAHADYEPPEPFAAKFADDPYAGEIAFVDHCIGQVIQKLKDLKLYDSTLLIITGDHGEMLGEHGEEEHSYFVYESAIKVPLVIRLPGQKKSMTVAQSVGLVDIVPTVCSLLGIERPVPVQGRDLSPFLRGKIPEPGERHLYTESVTPKRIGASTLMAISAGRWKYIQAPRPELYDVLADPGETNDLIRQEPQRARILEDKLRETLEQAVREDMDGGIALDTESIRRLESLGYVAGKAEETITFDSSKPDPKDLVGPFVKYLEAGNLTRKGEYERAKQLLLGLIEPFPEFHEIYQMLGDIEVTLGNFGQAVPYFRRSVELNSDETGAMNNLAWIQATRPSLPVCDVNEALTYAKKLCELTGNDPNSLDTLAVAYAATGDFTEAVAAAKKAVKLAAAVNDAMLVRKINGRLKLFEQSMPYIEE